MSTHEFAYSPLGPTEEERSKLVEDYLSLVRHVISRLSFSLPPFMDVDDLFGVGVVGLINAARTYNPQKGAQFKTHAYVNIRGAILDELRRHDVVPRSRRDRVKQFRKTCSELEDVLGRQPTPEEAAAAMGLEVAQIDDLLVNMNAVQILSMDDESRTEDGEGLRLVDTIRSLTSSPLDEAELNEMKARLRDAIVELPESERRVIVLYYAESMRLKEIGAILGVSESRVSQIHSRGLFLLERALSTKPEGLIS